MSSLHSMPTPPGVELSEAAAAASAAVISDSAAMAEALSDDDDDGAAAIGDGGAVCMPLASGVCVMAGAGEVQVVMSKTVPSAAAVVEVLVIIILAPCSSCC